MALRLSSSGRAADNCRTREKRGVSDRFLRSADLQTALDALERRDQRAADVFDDHDNSKKDAAGDERIFNGGEAGLVLEITRERGHGLHYS
jgi:hypothetical protein